jgi:hypothetical protein
VQFPKSSYSHVAFKSARFFAGGVFKMGSRAEVLLGLRAEADVSSSGSTVTLFYVGIPSGAGESLRVGPGHFVRQ